MSKLSTLGKYELMIKIMRLTALYDDRDSFEDCKKACPVLGIIYATEVFACRVRGKRPQGAAYPSDMETTYTDGHNEKDSLAGIRTLMNAAGPEREVDNDPFGNPYEYQKEEDET